MTFGQKLKSLRQNANMTQLELAETLRLSKANISKYESDTIQPNFETLSAISSLFDVTVDYLLGKDQAPAPRPSENTVTLFGRDGSKTDRTLTEEQYKLILGLLDQMPGEDK